jgi:dolichol-phosphate mannosyltransferase
MGNAEVNSRVGVILPTYCEAQNIEKLILEIENLPMNASILVVDDSSPDGTAEAVTKLQKRYPNILLMVRPQKCGLGTAITDGFKVFLSLKNVPEFVVTMDADYSHQPEDMQRLVANMQGGCGLAIGSRYCHGGKIAGWSFGRKVISRGANFLARSMLKMQLQDCTSGFRCYSTRFLREAIDCLHSHTYEIQIETIKQAHLKGFKAAEVPIAFVNRKRGKSKLSLVEIRSFVSYLLKTLTN